MKTAAASGTSVWWPRVKRWALPIFGVAVLALLATHAHKIDWEGAWQALLKYPRTTLLTVLGLCIASHMLYGCFDLIGRRHTKHKVGPIRTWAIALTSYAFNLNLGSIVGGVAMRARLYARAGLDEPTVAQVVGISLVTNWLGYGLLAGSLFASGLIAPPKEAHMGYTAFRMLGGFMILIAVAYVVVCAFARDKEWTFRKKKLHLPSPLLAVVQLAIATANWTLMGSAMYLLLGGKVDFGTTLAVLMTASIVGVITPIPAGLGVLEAVYLALLSGQVRQGALLGAVLAYRALYYLLPLMVAIPVYFALERYASTHPPAGA